MPYTSSSRFKTLAPLSLGALAFAGVIYSLGLRPTWAAITGARPAYILASLMLMVTAAFVRVYKWVRMRDRVGASIGFADLTGVYFSSKFWGLVSPMRSGEVAPALLRGQDRPKLLSIILYDRVLETFQSLIVFFVLFILLYGAFFNLGTGYALGGVAAVLAVFTAVLVSRPTGERILKFAGRAVSFLGEGRTAHLARRALSVLERDMEEFYGATRSYFTAGFSLFNLLLTFVCWAVDILSWVALFRAVSIGTSLLVTAAAVMVYSMIAALAPIPWGLGVSDLSFALVLSRFGYSGEIGGLIIISRVLVMGSTLAGYAAFSMPRLGKDI